MSICLVVRGQRQRFKLSTSDLDEFLDALAMPVELTNLQLAVTYLRHFERMLGKACDEGTDKMRSNRALQISTGVLYKFCKESLHKSQGRLHVSCMTV